MRYDKKRLEDAKTPSLEGFTAFVRAQMLRDPNASYWWSSSCTCAVACYLKSIGRYHEDWHWNAFSLEDWATAKMLDDLAHGPLPIRDARGRFTSTDIGRPQPIPQWTYRALWQRIEAKRANAWSRLMAAA